LSVVKLIPPGGGACALPVGFYAVPAFPDSLQTMHSGHHHHRLDADRRALTVALAIVAAVMGAEIAAGLVAHSLALLADAGHMVTDAGALTFAVLAARMAARPPGGRWTFGYSRIEILAAQANGIALA